MTDIAILGCGPSGLIAAWAAEQAGHDVTIFSIAEKSIIPGSQYLHGPIPGISNVYPEGTVQYVRLGTAEQYSQKVYGDVRETGWDNYLAVYKSWSVQKVYDILWERYIGNIRDARLNPKTLYSIMLTHDTVVSTIPQEHLCYGGHIFSGVPYYIRTLPTPAADENHDIVVYNGLPDDPWYRWSILGGVCSMEWCEDPGGERRKGVKATNNNCDCFAGPNFIRAGRWAEWKHGVLLHDVYHKVKTSLNGQGSEPWPGE